MHNPTSGRRGNVNGLCPQWGVIGFIFLTADDTKNRIRSPKLNCSPRSRGRGQNTEMRKAPYKTTRKIHAFLGTRWNKNIFYSITDCFELPASKTTKIHLRPNPVVSRDISCPPGTTCPSTTWYDSHNDGNHLNCKTAPPKPKTYHLGRFMEDRCLRASSHRLLEDASK